MADVAERRLEELRHKLVRRNVATSQTSDAATQQRSDVATQQRSDARSDVATEGATRAATDVATRAVETGVLHRESKEPTVRRAYTVYERQDELLRALAHDLGTDKSDILRQIIDSWCASIEKE